MMSKCPNNLPPVGNQTQFAAHCPKTGISLTGSLSGKYFENQWLNGAIGNPKLVGDLHRNERILVSEFAPPGRC